MTVPAPFDLVAGLAALVLLVYGLISGIARIVAGFAGLALGWILAARWCEPLALRMGASNHMAAAGPDWRRLAAFALIFAAVTLAFSILGWLVTRALGAVKLGGLNRLAGAAAGLLLAVVAACALAVPLVALSPPAGGALTRGSVLAPYAVAGGQYLVMMAPEPIGSRFQTASTKYFADLTAPQPTGKPTAPITAPTSAPSPRPR